MTTSPDVLRQFAAAAADSPQGPDSPQARDPLPSATLGGEKRRSAEQFALLRSSPFRSSRWWPRCRWPGAGA